MAVTKTAVIYARYSSDLQDRRSIDDQFALCRDMASRQNLTIVGTFRDDAESSASILNRPAVRRLMEDAAAQRFNVLLLENFNRLSRNPADSYWLYDRLTFYGVQIIAHDKGRPIDLIDISISSITGPQFLKDLGNHVRRGHDGRVRECKIPSRVAYGYRCVPGKPGEREIDPEEAPTVRRVFQEYVDAKSPNEIIANLKREGVPPPRGSLVWNQQNFVNRMISNPLYAGRIIWNKNRNVRNPDTGNIVKRPAPEKDRLVVDAPHLRIIDQALWNAAQQVSASRSVAKFGPEGKTRIRPLITRRDHLLAGLLRCGACGGPMRMARDSSRDRPRVGCGAAQQGATCRHNKSYDLNVLQATILDGIRKHLTDPEAIAELARGYHERWGERQRANRTDRGSIERKLGRLNGQIGRIVTAISDSDDPIAELSARLKQLQADRAGLAEQLRRVEAETSVVDLHPRAMEQYRQNVESLHHALTAEGTGTPGGRAAFRNLFDSIVVHPTGKRQPYQLTPYGRLSGILGAPLFPESTPEQGANRGNAYQASATQAQANVAR